MDALKDFNRDEGFTAGSDALRRLADQILKSLGPEDDVARVGSDEFAILAAVRNSDGAAQLAAKLERMLADDRTKATLGWAVYPNEGDNALGALPGRERAALRAQGDAELPAAGFRRGRRLEGQLDVGLLDHAPGRAWRGRQRCPIARDAREKLADRERVRVVEPGRRLVRDQEIRLRGQRPGDGDPLLLAGRKPRDPLLGELVEADVAERPLCAVGLRRGLRALQVELDVLASAEKGDDRWLLGYERDVIAAEPGPAARSRAGAPYRHDDVARRRQIEPGDQVQSVVLPEPEGP